MRRIALLLALVLMVGGAAAVLLLRREPGGPFPSEEHLRTRGFAAWPVDTVAEAEDECADPEEWRLDARATAIRFARDVLRYPAPGAGESYVDDDHRARLLVGSDDVPGVFLGSMLELARFGRCWYVTSGMPREGELGATLGFVYREGRPYLLLGSPGDVPPGSVGYGEWETEIHPKLRQGIVDMPELPAGATGHAIYTRPGEEGVSEIVGARSLGFVPPEPTGPPAEPLSVAEVVDNPNLCRIESSPYKSPERVIKELYRWTFDNLLHQVDGYPTYQRKRWRHLGGDRWRLVVDDAVLVARIPEIAGRCYQLVSLTPVGRDSPLRRLWVADAGVTFGIDWGGGDDASLAFGVGFDGRGATLRQFRETVTFPREGPPQPRDVPTYARVVLYKDGHVVSAFYGLFGGA